MRKVKEVKTTPRPLAEIEGEHARVCSELGHAVYLRDLALPRQIEELKAKLYALNLEHSAARAATATPNPESK